jgi:dolichol-phosphate mannosyltransferase
LKVSIVLPTYCERDNIVDLIQSIQNALQDECWETEILVIDDNSPDGTAQVVRDYQAGTGSPQRMGSFQINLFVRMHESGLATAIKYGLQQATGDVVVVMDTDFNHDPAMIPQMVRLLDFYDLVIGSRFVMGGGMEDRQRYYYSLFYNLFVRMILRLQIQDNLSGFFAVRRAQLMTLDLDPIFRGYGEYFIRLLYTAWHRKFRMLEVPVFYILRRHGQSKSRFLAMLRDYTGCLIATRLNGYK